jgi:prolyl-tRNA editing enzyme YbaK/EbsC (Cys-tRNA(Pro) deacylase)
MWPDAVQRVADFLRDARAEATIEEFPNGTPTAEAAAKAVGVEPARIVKSLVFVCDGLPVLALVPGDRRADREKIGRAVEARVCRVANREEVVAATGFAPGAVAPFPHSSVTAVLIDSSLLAHESVWVGAGSPNHLARLQPGELLRLSRARQMDAVAEHTYHSD